MQVYGSRKMLVLLVLGFSSGIPLFLASKTLQAWLTTEKIDLGVIGAFSLVNLPYSLKFVWAPLLDRYALPGLGRRRGWLLFFQIALVFLILGISWQNPHQLEGNITPIGCGTGSWGCLLAQKFAALYQSPFFWLTLAMTFCSASQDITADAYRTEILEERELGAGAAIFVLGYRLALLVTGGWAFILADHISWRSVYQILAPCLLIGALATWLAPEPQNTTVPKTLSEAVIAPWRDFLTRSQWLLVLAFVVLYKLGDALINNMSTPFLLQMGFSQSDLGTIQGGIGLVATIVGTLVGGGAVSKLGIYPSLWLFGILQALSNFCYLGLAAIGVNLPLLFITINLENFCAGLGTAAFTAFLMHLCNPQFTATQYALLSSLMAVSRDILIAPAGEIAQTIGWIPFFLGSVFLAIPGLIVLFFLIGNAPKAAR